VVRGKAAGSKEAVDNKYLTNCLTDIILKI